MTIDQQKAVAIATARLRLQQGAAPPPPDRGTVTVDQAQAAFDAGKPGPVSSAVSKFGTTLGGMASSAYHAFTDPATPEEAAQFGNQPGPIELGLKRTLVDPVKDRFNRIANAPTAKAKALEALTLIPPVGTGLHFAETAKREGVPAAIGEAGAVIAAPKIAEVIPEAAGMAAETVRTAPKTASDFLRDRFKPAPEVAALRATGPSAKPEVRASIPTVLNEVSQWSDETGQPVESVPQFRKAIDERIKVHTQIADAIAEPHNNTVVEGSRAEMAQAKIAAIPDDIRSEKPGQYANIVKSIKAAADQPDYTIGELNDLRKSLNTKNKSFGKNRTASMAAEYSTNAIDQAAGDYARNKFYDALEKESGQGQAVRAIKKATGDLMTYDNALRGRENQSVVESGKSFAQKAVELTGKAMTPGTTLKHFGENATIDSDLASAVRQWKRRPAPVLNAPRSTQAALPPASSQFEIDPSAVTNYQQGSVADRLFRKPAEPGEGIPMRDVTPPKQKLLTGAPAKITTYIQRSSGETFQMPASIKGLLDKWAGERKALPPAPPRQLTAASALRNRVFNLGGDVPPDIIEELTHENMNVFADIQESGIGETTGKLKREVGAEHFNAGDALKERMGGFKADTIFKKLPYGPKQIRDAIRAGKGKVYDQIKAVAREAAKDQAEQYLERQRATDERFKKDTADWNVD